MTTHEAWAPIPNNLFRLGWTKTELLVYLALLCLPFERNGIVIAGQTEISVGAGVSVRTTRDVLPRLAAAGVIVQKQLYDGIPSYYRVNELPRDGGFFRLPRRWLWETSLTATERIVYLVLLSRRNRRTGEAVVSWVSILAEARVTNRTLAPALDALTAVGLITRIHQPRRGKRQGINKYRVQLPTEHVPNM
ncbi:MULTISPECIES: hypothetical protein [unclassified Microbacterium]|uniref:hypothetical protein n=1 Tax=unclassified Microbacterium TaxID=2609290 RepID=UPI000EA8A4DE|nr:MULTISPECIES: hypothetical protein [unclassified Microbacterium]MBT2484628.1 hypothetical protein [Microbacterium sp. ISL-108]RKN67519.1 hypothetical protein D7252_07960 [Microbacterium sp. CGR2]